MMMRKCHKVMLGLLEMSLKLKQSENSVTILQLQKIDNPLGRSMVFILNIQNIHIREDQREKWCKI